MIFTHKKGKKSRKTRKSLKKRPIINIMKKTFVLHLKKETKRKIKNTFFNIIDKLVPIVVLAATINITVPQTTMASGIDIPAGKVDLPINLGRIENLTEHPNYQGRLPELTTERTPRYTIKASVSAYNSEAGQTDDRPCETASGLDVCLLNEQADANIVATNFLNLPFGSKVRLPDLYGDKIFVVEDRMNRRYQKHFDIWMPDKQKAIEFGRKYTRVEVF